MKNKISIIMFILFIVLQFSSCKDEITKPAETYSGIVTIKCTQQNTLNFECTVPVPAEITIFQTDDKGVQNQVYTGRAGSDGILKYNFSFPICDNKFTVQAVYNNITKNIPACFVCGDTLLQFCFEVEPPPDFCCDGLPADTTVNLEFFNEVLNNKLNQFQPTGSAEYLREISLFTNSCPDNIMQVTINQNVESPFSIKTSFPKIVNNRITLNPGQTLYFQFAVSTNTIGTFEDNLTFSVNCDNITSNWTVNLKAEVVAQECDCPNLTNDIFTYTYDEKYIEVGESSELLTFEVFRNLNKDASCQMRIDSIRAMQNNLPVDLNLLRYWTFFSSMPNIGQSVAINSSFSLGMYFRPTKYGENTDTLGVWLTLTNGNICFFKVILKGYGCDGSCPDITIDGRTYSWQDTVNVFLEESLSPDENCLAYIAKRSHQFINNFSLGQYACEQANLTITQTINEFNIFKLNETNLTIQPNQNKSVNVDFTSPTLEEFNSYRPGNTIKDSLFRFQMIVRGCKYSNQMVINIIVKVTEAAKISGILDLFAYNQYTWNLNNQPSNPDYMTCLIDEIVGNNLGYLHSLEMPRGSGRAPSSNAIPPDSSDFYINPPNPATDTLRPNSPPQPPFAPCIYLVNNPIRYNYIKLFDRNISSTDFTDVSIILSRLRAEVASNPNFFAASVDNQKNIQMGDVYVLYSDSRDSHNNPCYIALLYVVRRDDGSSNVEGRCGISFRLISRIFI